ncbi:MAG: hypothetical protein KGL39_16380 [Patescibacteria group bacterium]|nr:hypothetical protein [Patescibacteria group bacterium]
MRIYKDFPEALNEVRRDLAEMGILVHPQTYQDKNVEGDSRFDARELTNYIFTVTSPNPHHLNPTQPWADHEFDERISGRQLNPGKAYLDRREVWEQFLEKDDRFSYSYPARLTLSRGDRQVDYIIDRIKMDPSSRQLFMAVWDRWDIGYIGGVHRVPCSIGYLVHVRRGQVNLTYLQRSADFATHFVNDVYLAHRMQRYIAEQTGYQVGHYIHWIGSLHVFQKDVEGVF